MGSQRVRYDLVTEQQQPPHQGPICGVCYGINASCIKRTFKSRYLKTTNTVKFMFHPTVQCRGEGKCGEGTLSCAVREEAQRLYHLQCMTPEGALSTDIQPAAGRGQRAQMIIWVVLGVGSVSGGVSLCIHFISQKSPVWHKSSVGHISELNRNQDEFRKCIRSDQISHSVVSDSFRPHESQHARPPCPSPTILSKVSSSHSTPTAYCQVGMQGCQISFL